jgi:hypothetical protein
MLALMLCARTGTAAAPPTPEETVRRYLQAMKDGKFSDAYAVISKAMKQGKDQGAWVKEQRDGMAWAEVKIFSFQVQPGRIEGDKALVPNILSSQDRLVNQLGLTEYELYTLLKEDGSWKVDQQVIVEPSEVAKWFPKARPEAASGAAGASPPAGAPASH